MAIDDRPSSAQQENLLALLCFDSEVAPTIRNMVEVSLFDSDIYRHIADQAGRFLDRFKEPVGDHLADLFDIELQAGDRTSKLYDQVLRGLHELKGGVNKEYVLGELRTFIRQQQLKAAIVGAGIELQGGNVDQAEEIWRTALSTELAVFDPGVMFQSDPAAKVLSFLHNPVQFVPLGISYFDRVGIGPTKGELITVLGATGKGKSWFLMYMGKRCLMRRMNVLHISLEMSEPRCTERYIQSLFSISRRKESVNVPVFKEDKHGRFLDFDHRTLTRPSFEETKKTDKILRNKLTLWRNRLKLVIKQFPSNQLTFPKLRAYLDQLERSSGFIPDVLILDYADLMYVDTSILRIDLSRIYKDLRGLAVERSIPVLTASQTNRAGEDVRVASLKHLAEDYSKAAISDIVISYNQTLMEEKIGIARLFVAKNRNEESRGTVVTSQAYAIGQFHMSSVLLSNKYWDVIEGDI